MADERLHLPREFTQLGSTEEIYAFLRKLLSNQTVQAPVLWAFAIAIRRHAENIGYRLGAGHDPRHPFQPTGTPPEGDCSWLGSNVWHRAEPTALREATDTTGLL